MKSNPNLKQNLKTLLDGLLKLGYSKSKSNNILKLFKQNLKNDYLESNTFDSPSYIIANAFSWSDSFQHHSFWLNIHEKLKESESNENYDEDAYLLHIHAKLKELN